VYVLFKDIKFTVIGAGYVGLSLATLISEKYQVSIVEAIRDKVVMINDRKSPISDKDIERYLSGNKTLIATDDINVCVDSDFIIVAVPTNYNPDTNEFDTSCVDSVINDINSINSNLVIIIKSTVPIGYVEKLYMSGVCNVLFSPEFLREGHALFDNLYPSRIIVGVPSNDVYLVEKAKIFADILKECSLKKDVNILITGVTEAESIKLFSNSYLAMRISYFNELDTFAEMNGLDSKDIISGVCMDPRIGNYYNNPSFGYGGYCLPKDSKQLLSNYQSIPEEIIGAIVRSNQTRKRFIINQIINKIGNSGTVGIYRLIMKSGSDNFRESSVLNIISELVSSGVKVIIYEPQLRTSEYCGCKIVEDIENFKMISDLIVANRIDEKIKEVNYKVYTRDVFARD
jgi:UDPglucose 6-dehydrogenase